MRKMKSRGKERGGEGRGERRGRKTYPVVLEFGQKMLAACVKVTLSRDNTSEVLYSQPAATRRDHKGGMGSGDVCVHGRDKERRRLLAEGREEDEERGKGKHLEKKEAKLTICLLFKIAVFHKCPHICRTQNREEIHIVACEHRSDVDVAGAKHRRNLCIHKRRYT